MSYYGWEHVGIISRRANDDPKDYDSLIAEMFAEQNPIADIENDDSELDAVDVAEELSCVPVESVDAYY